MTNEIYAWVPVRSLARFSIEKPEGWDLLSYEEKEAWFLNTCDECGDLCDTCKTSVSTKYDIDLESIGVLDFFDAN